MAAVTDPTTVLDDLGIRADENWREHDAHGRLSDDLFDSIHSSGLLRALVPAAMGGGGATPVEWFGTGLALARHDPSLGWVVTQGAAELGWIAAAGDPAWAAEVLRHPRAASASTTAGLGHLKVDGRTARVGGRWPFNTGCHHATWIGGLCLVESLDGRDVPSLQIAWVPADRAEIVDDWDPTGMRGTGSNTTVIPDQSADPAWALSIFEPTPQDRGPHRCLVGNGNWPIATAVAAVQLGAARRAIDETRELALVKAPPPDMVLLAHNASVQRTLVRAEGLWNACRSSVADELEAMWDEARREEELTAHQRVRLLAANATASRQAVAIIDAMCDVAGTAAMDRAHPLSRMRRDAHALHGHIAVNGATVEAAGRMLVGLCEADIRV